MAFKFKGNEFVLPIAIFIRPKNNKAHQSMFYLFLLVMSLSIVIPMQLQYNLYAFFSFCLLVIGYGVFIVLAKKPKLLLYADKVVLVNHGLIKPKELAWQDCILKTHHKDNVMLDLLYQNQKKQTHRFCRLYVKQICFDGVYFNKDDTLAFFMAIKNRAGD